MDLPEWNPRTAYGKGTRVSLDGKTYEALAYVTGIAPDSAKAQDLKVWRSLEAES